MSHALRLRATQQVDAPVHRQEGTRRVPMVPTAPGLDRSGDLDVPPTAARPVLLDPVAIVRKLWAGRLAGPGGRPEEPGDRRFLATRRASNDRRAAGPHAAAPPRSISWRLWDDAQRRSQLSAKALSRQDERAPQTERPGRQRSGI